MSSSASSTDMRYRKANRMGKKIIKKVIQLLKTSAKPKKDSRLPE
jgi:hypothetical protein